MPEIPGTNALGYDIDAQIKAVKREIGMRQAMFYKAPAERQGEWRNRIREMEAVLTTLEQVKATHWQRGLL